LVGTDGFRLSLLKTKKEVDFPNLIVDSGFLNEVLYFIDKEEEVGFSYLEKEKTLYFQIEDNDLYSRIIEGDYPPFEKVIPAQEGKTKVFVDKESFLRNLKLISVFTRDFSNVVIFDIKKDGVYLRPKTEEEKNNNQAFLEAQVRGEEVKVAFNHKFLIDFLNHFKQKELVFEIIRPDAPVVFKDPEKDNFLHIIMPVRIQE
jgi:DNA polymerase sliding clamp subunit (PCNA homolog)